MSDKTEDGFEAGDPSAAAEETTTEAQRTRLSARERRHNRNGFLAMLGGLMSLTLIGALALGALLYLGAGLLASPGPLGEDRVVTIPEGAGANTIAQILQREGALPARPVAGIVDPKQLFRTAVRTQDAASKLQAGEYSVPAGVSVNGLVELLTSGSAIQHRITIPEGLTSYQVVQRIANHEVLEGPIPPVPAEGSILPETYAFQRGTTRGEILEDMMEAQAAIVAKAWAARDPDLPIKSPEDLVTLASIVEKETGVGGERPHVASVFVNRLRRGQRLETDPTVIYGIFGGEGKPSGRPIYRSDLQNENPYNTYQIPGLPPGPIANPGEAALMATAQPLETDDYFFVADGTGGHVFAKTYQEHLANVAEWRKIEREMKARREASAAVDAEEADADGQTAGGETTVAETGDAIPGVREIIRTGTQTDTTTTTVPVAATTSAPATEQEYAAEGSPVPLPLRRAGQGT